MAEKRMFSTRIIDSDRFMDLPATTQNLYFHLVLRADDDGFISHAKQVMRMLGAKDDDLNLLILKSFIIKFESGVYVITDWLVHNNIRADRKTATLYKKELSFLEMDNNKSYIKNESKKNSDLISSLENENHNLSINIDDHKTNGVIRSNSTNEEGENQVMINDIEHNVGKGCQMSNSCPHRLVKISIDKYSKDKINKKNKQKKENEPVGSRVAKDQVLNKIESLEISSDLKQAYLDYYQHRKEIKKKLTPLAFSRALKQFENWGYNDDQIIQSINNTIANGWTGLFEIKRQPALRQQKESKTGNLFFDMALGDNNILDMGEYHG